MLERTAKRFGLKPQHLAADSAYGSAENLAWLIKEKKIAPHIPVFDKSQRTDGTFSRSDFVYDPEQDHYTCPGGQRLVQYRRNFTNRRSGVTKDGVRFYRARQSDCQRCDLKSLCCPNTPRRRIPRNLDEDARCGTCFGGNSGLRALPSPSQEDRDAVCPPQTHLEAGASETARAERCKGRVPAGGHGSEPETARQAAAHAHLCWGRSMTMCLQPARSWLWSPDTGLNTVIPQL
jgi:hypothetical protein